MTLPKSKRVLVIGKIKKPINNNCLNKSSKYIRLRQSRLILQVDI